MYSRDILNLDHMADRRNKKAHWVLYLHGKIDKEEVIIIMDQLLTNYK